MQLPHPKPHALGPMRWAALVCMPLLVGLITLAVLVGHGPTRLDVIAHPGAAAGFEPVLFASFGLTALGGTDGGLILTVAGVCVLLAGRLWAGALALVVAVASTQLVVDLFKEAVSRPRPAANSTLAEASGFSFPSGHSATSAALFGTIALVAARHAPERVRTALIAVSVALIALVGATRVALGAHYATDVLAGWLVGATVALVSLGLASALHRALARRPALR